MGENQDMTSRHTNRPRYKELWSDVEIAANNRAANLATFPMCSDGFLTNGTLGVIVTQEAALRQRKSEM